MTSTLSAPLNAEQRAALRRIEAFRQRFGEGHFYLACHAALPLALTPDLLYCLWVNFQQDSHQQLLDIPWIAVSDLILSNLCEEVGYELYEMDAAIRDELLRQLQHNDRFGLERIRELADFVMAYVEQELDHPDLDTKDLAQIQKLRALAYKQPSEAAHEIVLILTQLKLKDKTEWIRIAALVNSLVEPLSAFQHLLGYIRAMADLARGNLEAATVQMNKAVDANNQVRVEGVNLPIPDIINGMLRKNNEPDAPPPLSLDRLRFPLAIAGGTIVSVLILIGVQYGLRSPTPQPTSVSSATPTPQSSSSATSIFQPSATPLSFPSPASPQALPVNTQGTVASQPPKTPAPTSSPTSTPSASKSASNLQSPAPSLDSSTQLLPNPTQSSPTQPPSAPVQSSPPSPGSTQFPASSSPTIPVTTIEVSGSTVLSSKDLDPITQPVEERPVTLGELRSVANEITQLYKNRGYITSGAILSDQTVTNGAVQIKVIEGSLERIEIEGTQNIDPDYIRQIVQKGVSMPLNMNSLEAQLRLLKADPKFTSVEASLRPGTQPGQSTLLIRVTEAASSETVGVSNIIERINQLLSPSSSRPRRAGSGGGGGALR